VLRRAPPADLLQATVSSLALGLTVLDESGPGTARRRLRERPPANGALTAREREILDMLAEGASNRAIAARLGISRHTVKYHVASVLTKLGARTRAAAVTLAVRSGLLVL
jgi:DNA-binding CsgD family transcriptional regulator